MYVPQMYVPSWLDEEATAYRSKAKEVCGDVAMSLSLLSSEHK